MPRDALALKSTITSCTGESANFMLDTLEALSLSDPFPDSFPDAFPEIFPEELEVTKVTDSLAGGAGPGAGTEPAACWPLW